MLIAAVSLAGRRWGPGVSGWLLGLPLNSGPVLLFLALEQGQAFAAKATLGSLLGIMAWGAFTPVYAWFCLRLPWWWSTLIGWTAYALVALLLLPVKISVAWAFALVSVALAVTLAIFPRTTQPAATAAPSRYDLLLRMSTAAVMVVTLTGIAQRVGPVPSGILTAFPAYTTILAVFSHRQSRSTAVSVMRGVLAGLYTAATFNLVLSFTLLRLRMAPAFMVATLAALVIQAGSLVLVRRMSRLDITNLATGSDRPAGC
jgi:hypothetical protein